VAIEMLFTKELDRESNRSTWLTARMEQAQNGGKPLVLFTEAGEQEQLDFDRRKRQSFNQSIEWVGFSDRPPIERISRERFERLSVGHRLKKGREKLLRLFDSSSAIQARR
jgi:hypothetical protein